MTTSELLRQFEDALRKRNPELCERLQPGLPEKRIRAKLEKAGVTGNVEPLVLKPDGTVMQGNHRVNVLEERGYDLNKLLDLLGSGGSAASQTFDDLFT